ARAVADPRAYGPAHADHDDRRGPAPHRGAGAGAPRPGRRAQWAAVVLRRVRRGRRRAGAGAGRRRPEHRRPGRHLGAERPGVDAAAVRHRPHGPGARHGEPGLPHQRAGVRAQAVRLPVAGRRAVVQDQRLPGDGRRGARGLPAAGAGAVPRRSRLGRAARPRPRARRGRAAGPRGRAHPRRRDLHPVHEWNDRLPEGRDAVAPQHPQQRVVRRGDLPLHRAGQHLHPRALLPLLRHGDGQPGRHLARRGHGDPGARLRPRRHAARGRAGALHLAVRRADHVHRRAGARAVRVRPVVAAHRHHGRLAVPGGGHEAGHGRHAHGRGDDLLRHDRDLAGVDADHHGRPRRAPGVDDRAGPPARRGQGRRPRHRRDGPPWPDRRAVHPGLLGDARLLAGPGEDRRGRRRGRLDAHRRPGGDGRAGLPEHRRAVQGHGHPGGRERLPARARGVPLRPPGRAGRAGDRGARPALRRGAVRVGQGAARRAGDRGGGEGVLPRAAGALQGAALRDVRGRVPDDDHRQDPEVQDARADDRHAGADRRGPDGV
ncbi:MAG: Long-chain-fatty-acid--CoA ligase @ Long-chain fatty-acid-CoA ligase, Mycobacterial subgroup FadD35, partial [uncultured Frankineae bacterium]